MDIVNFYQSAGLGDPTNAKADVWEKMKGAAGGESPGWEGKEGERMLGAGMTSEDSGGRSRSGSGSEDVSSKPKYSNPVRLKPDPCFSGNSHLVSYFTSD